MCKKGIQRAVLITGLIIALSPRLALAHDLDDGAGPANFHELWHAWAWEPLTLFCLALSAGLYAVGMTRLWCSSRPPARQIHRRQAWSFFAGWAVLFLTLISPLHPLGQVLFSAHMVQHELLMLLAAPLLVLSRPMVIFLHGMPAAIAHALGRFSNTTIWKSAWGAMSTPLVAWLLHAAVLWLWHAPSLFQATLHHQGVHAAQHISFLASSLLFWWALIHGHHGVKNYGAAVLYLFTTAIHSGLLGALLTFARSAWYPDYDDTQLWGMTALEDQQIGGLIMWVPACTIYVIAGLVMFAAWLKQSEHPASRRTADYLPETLLEERSAT